MGKRNAADMRAPGQQQQQLLTQLLCLALLLQPLHLAAWQLRVLASRMVVR
jgi:hypothetical protein